MAEYISTKALGEFMADFYKNMPALFKWTELLWAMSKIPRADVVERKTGKWIELPPSCNGAILTKCSSCKRILTDVQLGMVKRFCPNCGAQMIGGDEDV